MDVHDISDVNKTVLKAQFQKILGMEQLTFSEFWVINKSLSCSSNSGNREYYLSKNYLKHQLCGLANFKKYILKW